MSDSVYNRLQAVRYFNLLAHGSDIHFVKAKDRYIHIRASTSFDPVHMSEVSFVERAKELLATKRAQIEALHRHLKAIDAENENIP